MRKTVLPNFIIVGAAKSGTTTLYHYLNQHPQIYMSPTKETNFFSFEGEELNFLGKLSDGYRAGLKTTLDEYSKEFDGVANEIAIGEACPSYLYISKASERIQHHIPDARIIAILRNPVDRAFSNFLHHIRDRLETYQNFSDAIDVESERISQGWWWGYHYINAGFYSHQIKRYYQRFGTDQVKIFLYEDLQRKPEQLMNHLFEFLSVDQLELEVGKKHNKTGLPKYKVLDYLIKEDNPVKSLYKTIFSSSLRRTLTAQAMSLNPIEKPMLSTEIRSRLVEVYKDEIIELQEIINRDLSAWLIVT